MLAADIEKFQETIKTKDRDSLIRIAVEIYTELSHLEDRVKETERSSHEMFLEFEDMKNRLARTERENRELRKQNLHLTGVYTSQAQEMYGKSSEKLPCFQNEILKSEGYSNPLDEDCPAESTEPEQEKQEKVLRIPSFSKNAKSENKKLDLSKLPQREFYEYDIELLNQEYGEGNWRFCYWNRSETIELVRQYTYCKVTYTPIVSVGLEHILARVPFEDRIIPKSPVSASLLSLLLCDYGEMHIPFYRMEQDSERFGLSISRQNMTHWMMYVSENLFSPVIAYLKSLLCTCPYQQCDETTYNAIEEKDHTTNYIWSHRTSECYDTNPIILFCFKPSRAATHLLNFYSDIARPMHLTSDAYGAYHLLEESFPGFITLCGCFMHARRRFVDSARIVRGKFTNEELENLPEMKAIKIIRRIYEEENKLKTLSADARTNARKQFVKPLVDEYFDYINGLDENNPAYSDKLRDAICYSRNQEESLRRFLDDGNIPIDNGACERDIKSIATHRKNSLFSFSVKGAQATMNVLSLIETAKENGAIPFYYLKYVMESMARGVYYNHPYHIEDMVPWSEQYRHYESEQCQHPITGIPPGNEKPRTPRKKLIAETA